MKRPLTWGALALLVVKVVAINLLFSGVFFLIFRRPQYGLSEMFSFFNGVVTAIVCMMFFVDRYYD